MKQRARQLITPALLATGFAALLLAPPAPVAFGRARWTILTIVLGAALIPAVNRRADDLLQQLRRMDRPAQARTSLVVALAAGVYLLVTAALQGRDFFPKTYDDQAYLLQMRLLATGRLWSSPHPLADFFDSVHVITEPVYAAAYFPGTALMYVPAVWLGLPAWVLPLIAAAACVGLLYWIVAELVDGLAGVLAALVLVSSSWFRMLSILVMSQVPALLLGLLMVWAWLRWRRSLSPAVPLAACPPVSGDGRETGPSGALAGKLPVARP